MSLNLIYNFQASQNQEDQFRTANYHVVYFFSEEGFLDLKMLQEMAKVTPEANHTDLTFSSLDDLKEFSLRVAQEYQKPEVRLISVQDYNIGVDGARDLHTFREIFNRYGDVVVNSEATKKKSFLGKLFS